MQSAMPKINCRPLALRSGIVSETAVLPIARTKGAVVAITPIMASLSG